MIFLIHSDTDEHSIQARLGWAEYSYYFVLKAFRPVLESLGSVVPIRDPAREVEALYRRHRDAGEECVFLSFSAPHRTPVDLACPTFCVFAWEYEDVPTETWDADPRNDWRFVFQRLAGAITHSTHAARVVRKAMGAEHPVLVVPAPLWDRFRPDGATERACTSALDLEFEGWLLDSRDRPAAEAGAGRTVRAYSATASLELGEGPLEQPAKPPSRQRVTLEGVVYTAVLNPLDGRKNWQDLLRCFCVAHRERPDATLLLKVVSSRSALWRSMLRSEIARHQPMRCRVVVIDAFLDDLGYATLARGSTYALSSSLGEGQCLPLMEFMSAGCPAVAPRHTGLEDYVDDSTAFVVRSSLEPASWPHDPRHRITTFQHRIDAASLMAALSESHAVAAREPERYRRMSRNATARLRRHASRAIARERLHAFLHARLQAHAAPH